MQNVLKNDIFHVFICSSLVAARVFIYSIDISMFIERVAVMSLAEVLFVNVHREIWNYSKLN